MRIHMRMLRTVVMLLFCSVLAVADGDVDGSDDGGDSGVVAYTKALINYSVTAAQEDEDYR